MATWTRVQEAFLEAMDLEPAARRQFLDELAAESSAVAAEVGSLLAADHRAGEFWGKPVVPTDVRLRAGVEMAPVPDWIGPYRVVERLGSGGMSDVFLAEREDDDFTRRVAVKLIRGELAREDFVRRFELERQILARLTHPNIAPLLDGGATEEGLPYLVMERVEGAPIDLFCDGNRFSIDDRLELFLAVCSAVHYAHQNLIVHRDIKTGNILVTADGVPKLLDFGIAKLLNPESFPLEVERTATRLRPMTPYYASPEQIENGVITTATDVYSLGVLLFRLLTGEFPYRYDDRTPRAVEERTLRDTPDTLTAALARSEHPLHELAAERSTTPHALRKTLASDLDRIVAMALRKEPERRYESVGQFATDILHYRQGLPVVAHRDSFVYRVRKFVGRNRAASALSGLIAVLLTLFGAAMAIQAKRLERERDQVQLERDRADQVIGLLQESFRSIDPMDKQKAPGTTDEVLVKGAERVRSELGDRPILRAQLLEVIGGVLRNLGSYDDAAVALAEARDAYGSLEDDISFARTTSSLGAVLALAGELDRGGTLLRQGVELLRECEAPRELLAEGLHSLGKLLQEQGDVTGSERHYREAARVNVDLFGPMDTAVAPVISDLAILLNEDGRHEEAEPLFRRALQIRLDNFSERHPLVAESRNNLAVFFAIRGKFDQAEVLFRQSLAVRHEVLGNDHPDVGEAVNNLGLLLMRKGEYRESERLFREALRVHELVGGQDHLRTTTIRKNLAVALREMNRLDEARLLLDRVVDIRESELGETHPSLGYALIELARLALDEDDASGCASLVMRVSEVYSVSLPSGHWRNGEAKGLAAECLQRLGEHADALALAEESARIMSHSLGESHPQSIEAAKRAKTLRSLN